MSRENQPLQIALVVFAMLAVVLAVTAFVFFRQHEEAAQQARVNLAEASIVEEAIRDPILQGDKVHAPGWTPRR